MALVRKATVLRTDLSPSWFPPCYGLLRLCTLFGVNDIRNPRACLTVTVQDGLEEQSLADVLAACRKQLEDARLSGDVTRVYKCDVVEIDGHSGVETDVERKANGRGHDYHLVFGRRWVGIAVIALEGRVDELNPSPREIRRSLQYEAPSREAR